MDTNPLLIFKVYSGSWETVLKLDMGKTKPINNKLHSKLCISMNW